MSVNPNGHLPNYVGDDTVDPNDLQMLEDTHMPPELVEAINDYASSCEACGYARAEGDDLRAWIDEGNLMRLRMVEEYLKAIKNQRPLNLSFKP